jgi:hypothetical protein
MESRGKGPMAGGQVVGPAVPSMCLNHIEGGAEKSCWVWFKMDRTQSFDWTFLIAESG